MDCHASLAYDCDVPPENKPIKETMQLDPSTERYIIRTIERLPRQRLWLATLIGAVLGGGATALATGYFYAQLVTLCL